LKLVLNCHQRFFEIRDTEADGATVTGEEVTDGTTAMSGKNQQIVLRGMFFNRLDNEVE
jgi:hypothetical protein